MAKNDPDGKHKNRNKFSLDESDSYRDRAASIERNYQRRVRQGLLSIANANLTRLGQEREAANVRGQGVAAAGASGLQNFGARTRSSRATEAATNREARSAHRLGVLATRQELADDRRSRDADHAVNLRDLMAGRYA